ncbi:cell morphogenesis protein PAG1 [Gaeumannomyces tritici R3-111a-1]|uniref:Cell morphogenesis protein PAG1 n=1 Tax=Gaeumannomyces tritici (strain R3-111a-1) TaxID=644352 RepID=J3NNJ6_GAET3|nr:cell morphogenesis protein PAG1 [Gaeumannomyces tritici R3-111a-1]EJT77748.1 cell morphogenesis protein PAG1 [Gaeumannomyces tritici R3-111a-1]
MAPSQALPEHAPDPLKFSPRAVTRLDEEGEEAWDHTLRPFAFDFPQHHPRLVAHSRESSIEKIIAQQHQHQQQNQGGRAPSPAGPSVLPVSSPVSALSSARLHGAAARPGAAIAAVIERAVDPKPVTYGHHRQTSIVHGIRHSRNGSQASTSSSPLSPQMIAATGAAFSPDRPDMGPYGFAADPDSSSLSSSRPSTTASGTTLVGSPNVPERTSSVADVGSHTPGHRKPERVHSGKAKRHHAQHPSHSSRHKDDQKTVGGYAMHVLFTSFIAQAEEKLNECIASYPSDPEPQVEQICGPGADPSFDQLIVALGHIAKQKPRALIDSMMLWRKSKSDAAGEARKQLQQLKTSQPGGPLLRRNTEPVQPPPAGGTMAGDGGVPLATKQEYVTQTERRSSVSTYLLCRVLHEVISQSSLDLITPEMEDKLEDIIFSQLKVADTEQLMISPLKLANWNIFAQLLGVMSEINFTGVAGRFIQDLERSLQELGSRGSTSPSREEIEGGIELVLGGMKHLKIALSPEDAWEKSCDFMSALGRLFARSHGQKIKSSFCQILEMLLLPIAAKATNIHFTHPKWADVLSTISPRLAQMFVKPRHWYYSFPLTATMLCVSSPEAFSSQWLQLAYPLQPKLKDRYTKPLCLQVISRLLWTYLYRNTDSPSATTRKLDEVLKLVLPTTAKRTAISTDTAVSEPLIQIIRIVGFKHPEFCFKTIIFPLVNADLFSSNKELKVENLDPDKIVIGIRAFLAVMTDLERGELGRPPFPQYYPSPPPPDRATPASPAGIVSFSGGAPGSPLEAPSADEGPSRRVMTAVLSESVRGYYVRFCEILGKITIICDNTFGGQAALDEKFNSPTPKTPIADTFNFSRREEHQNPSDHKQAFYELLHVAVQALPRCLAVDIPFNSLINLLCTGTAHVQYNIAESSATSLKAIARQSYAQQVTMGFSRFIFNFDDRYSTMSDGGMLGAAHIENTLSLYVELLHIWIEEIRQKTKNAAGGDLVAPDKRGMKLDLSSIWAEVDQVEAHGLFFLCSQSRRVRAFSITVLRLITEFDTALGKSSDEKDGVRLIDVLENDYARVMSFNDEHLSVAERSRLQRGMQDSSNHGLIKLCSSDVSYDTTLWFKAFPHLIRVAYDRCPFAIAIGRDLICNRILQMYKAIILLSEPSRGLYFGSDPGSARAVARTPTTQPELVIEQWKLYLIFACTTMADPGALPQPKPPQGVQHGRKGSNKTSATTDKIVTARVLFKYLTPMLSASSASVREAVVVAMGSINLHIYRTLLEELQGHVSRCNDEARARIHQRANSSPRRNSTMDLLRTEITHVYKLTSHFLKDPTVIQDDWILSNLVTYAKDLKLFLMDGEVQMDWEFQKLRRHYCGLVEELFEGVKRTKDPTRWMTFEARKSAFALMEDWCGFSPNQTHIRHREDTMRQSVINQQSLGERGTLSAAMEIEKRNLRTAALSAMAALCGGPISVTTESGVSLQFDLRRMLGWIESIFTTPKGNDRMKATGRRALKNLIVHNQEYPYLLEHCIGRCYLADVPKVLECYFCVITEVLLEYPEYPASFWKLLPLCLFTLGNDQSDIRIKSARILRTLEERQQPSRSSKLQDFDISISDKTKAVYKLAQYKISERLSKQYTELAFYFFSELSLYFKDLQPGAQGNMVAVVLPWIQSIELKVDPNGGPVAQSYMLLSNLLEITVKASSALHNEVQALWQALATGPHPGNVRLVLDFIMSLCLERREQNFVEYAKQIVAFLASANSSPGQKVVEFLLLQITPKAMVPNEKREMMPPPPDVGLLPYCADLSDTLPIGTKQAGFSLGQLSMILLVDLIVSPVKIVPDIVPVLLQAVTVLWDHYTPLVQEQAREMLVHLIHELVIARLDDATPSSARKPTEDLIDLIRSHDKAVVWNYEDSNGKADGSDHNVPPSMEYLAAELVKTFEARFPGIKEQWARQSLTWATSCPVRHLACRSFQIFRCIQTSLDQFMLGDMLARLSNTIADEDPEIQTFAMEILATLKTLISSLDADKLATFPQLFWTTCACLDSINEREFLGGVEMLNEYLDRLDFSSPSVQRLLLDGRPPKWDGYFEGLQPLLYKGLRSSICLEVTLATLDRLALLQGDLIGDECSIFFAIAANLPRFLHAMDQPRPLDESVARTAEVLRGVAVENNHSPVALVLTGFLSGNYQTGEELIQATFSAFKESFSAQLDFRMIVMIMGFLTNRISWVKYKTTKVLHVIISEIDMRRPDIAGHGSDLLSPLLRLLQTEYCMEALQVLDNIMNISGSSMDNQHLRMSMTRPTSKAARKEYERTQSLFGIPEESGWAIPMPAKKTDSTRANIHTAFYMCQSVGGAMTDVTPTPEVEFHADEFPYGYFPSERTETMMSDEARGDGNAGDLVMKLDSLDDFFDDLTVGPPSEGRSSHTVTELGPADNYELGAQLYDEQVLPILHQASANSSFQNGFVDRSSPHPRDGGGSGHTNMMTPGAFSFGQFSPSLGRPGLHSRSITSPSAPASYHPNMGEITSDDELFSDGDDERPNTGAGGSGSFFLENMVKPLAQSTRTRMRRLTGSGKTREERQQQVDLMRSERAGALPPQVPKLPSSYLRGGSPPSTDMV